MKITISEIKINAGRREASLSGIDELARSISEVGLLNPITIAPDHTLIAGLHRLEAAKRLCWTEIECTICGLEGLQAELAEIDENVVRTALSTIEYGELLERRREIYESLYPETKTGQAQAAGMNRATGKHVGDKMSPTPKSFAQDTAGKLGVSVRTVERTMQTMKGLTQEAREVFRSFPNYKLSQSNAAKLSQLDPAKQKTAAILLASCQIRSVDEYEPEQSKRKLTQKQEKNKKFLESIAELKDPTKCDLKNPDFFLSEYKTMVYHLQQQMSFYHEPCYEESISSLSKPEIDELEKLTDYCCEMMQDFVRQIKEDFTHPCG